MNKETLRYIKNDMWNTLSNKKYLQATLKVALKDLEAERKKALAEFENLPEDSGYRFHSMKNVNDRYDKLRFKLVESEYEQWHNSQSYYLIYKDGSEISITAEDILGGEKFPKMSDIVYAELQSADEMIDTEREENLTGILRKHCRPVIMIMI